MTSVCQPHGVRNAVRGRKEVGGVGERWKEESMRHEGRGRSATSNHVNPPRVHTKGEEFTKVLPRGLALSRGEKGK